jgi:P2-related tail formation protein
MSASRYDLLPPNATQLERDLSRVTSSLVRTGPPVPLIRTAKRTNIPDSVVPWLIYEYGLGEILPFLGNNQRQALAEGVLWQRIRGTPESVRIALSWIGINGLIEESEGGTYRWAEYQLGLSAATTGDEIINNIAGLARISSPVRSRLQRIYAVYDMRMGVFDETSFDECIYDDHSGVRPRPDWPQISYGQNHARHVSRDGGSVSSALTIGHGAHILMIDHLRYDYSRFDEDSDIINYSSNLTISDQIASSVRYEGQTWTAISWRQDKAWADVNAVVSSSLTMSGAVSSASWVSANFRASSSLEMQFARSASWAYANARVSSTMSTETNLSGLNLYLGFNGADLSQNFVDSGGSGLAVTAVNASGGTPCIRTTVTYNGQSTGFFGGIGWLSIPSATIDFAANDFEISVLVRPTSTVGIQTIAGIWPGPSNASWRLLLVGEAVHFAFSTVGEANADGNGKTCATGNVVNANTWSLIRATRAGNQFKIQVNGNQEGAFTSSETIKPPSSVINIGRLEQDNIWYFVGNMKNLLIDVK